MMLSCGGQGQSAVVVSGVTSYQSSWSVVWGAAAQSVCMSVVYDYQVTDMDGPGVCGVAERPQECGTPCTPPLIVVVVH